MRRLLSVILVGCLFVAGPAVAERAKTVNAKATAGCGRTVTLPNGCYIYKNSAPLRRGGPGTPLIGYRIEPTLITNSCGANAGGSISIHGSNGTQIGSCPKASAHGAKYRARCTMNTRSLRSSARRAGGQPGGYFKLSGTCVKVPDFGRCYGSVKGLCNRTIS